eukprot:521035-Pyramimonas_sp.AAC.1
MLSINQPVEIESMVSCTAVSVDTDSVHQHCAEYSPLGPRTPAPGPSALRWARRSDRTTRSTGDAGTSYDLPRGRSTIDVDEGDIGILEDRVVGDGTHHSSSPL